MLRLALLGYLLRTVFSQYESHKYVYPTDIVEFPSSANFQRYLSVGINTLQLDETCPELMPRLARSDYEMSFNDIIDIYGFAVVPESGDDGYLIFLIEDDESGLYARLFHDTIQDKNDIFLMNNNQFIFCSLLYNPEITRVFQVVCVQQTNSTVQTINNITVNLITSETSYSIRAVPGCDFSNRVTTFLINLQTIGPVEVMYQPYSLYYNQTSTAIVFSTLSNIYFMDLTRQINLPKSTLVNRIYSVQKLGNQAQQGSIYLVVGYVDGTISGYLCQINLLETEANLIVSSSQIDFSSYSLTSQSYVQIECVNSAVNLIYIQSVDDDTFYQCQLQFKELSQCIAVRSESIANTVVDRVKMYITDSAALQVFRSAIDGSTVKSQICYFVDIDIRNDCTGLFLPLNDLEYFSDHFIGYYYRSIFVAGDLTHMMLFNGTNPATQKQKTCTVQFDYYYGSDVQVKNYEGIFSYQQITSPLQNYSFSYPQNFVKPFTNNEYYFPFYPSNFFGNWASFSFNEYSLSTDYTTDASTQITVFYNNFTKPSINGTNAILTQSVLLGAYMVEVWSLPSSGGVIYVRTCNYDEQGNIYCDLTAQSKPLASDIAVSDTRLINGYLIAIINSTISGNIILYLDISKGILYQISEGLTYLSIDFESDINGNLYCLNSTVPWKVDFFNVIAGRTVYIFSYTVDQTESAIVQSNFVILKTIYAKMYQRDILPVAMTRVVYVDILTSNPDTSKIYPRGDISVLDQQYVCSTNSSDIFQTNSQNLLIFHHVSKRLLQVPIPSAFMLDSVACGTSDYIALCVKGNQQFQIVSVRINPMTMKMEQYATPFPVTSYTSCNNVIFNDYNSIGYLSLKTSVYLSNLKDPSFKFFANSLHSSSSTITFKASNWINNSNWRFNIIQNSNNITTSKTKVDFSVTQYDIEPNIQGDIFNLALVDGTYPAGSIGLSPRVTSLNDQYFTSYDGLLSYSQGTQDGSYCLEIDGDPSFGSNITFMFGQVITNEMKSTLVFWAPNVIDYGYFTFSSRLNNFVTVYFNTTLGEVRLAAFYQNPDNSITQVNDIPINRSILSVWGMYDFGNLKYLYILQESDPYTFTFILNDIKSSLGSWFTYHQSKSCLNASL